MPFLFIVEKYFIVLIHTFILLCFTIGINFCIWCEIDIYVYKTTDIQGLFYCIVETNTGQGRGNEKEFSKYMCISSSTSARDVSTFNTFYNDTCQGWGETSGLPTFTLAVQAVTLNHRPPQVTLQGRLLSALGISRFGVTFIQTLYEYYIAPL